MDKGIRRLLIEAGHKPDAASELRPVVPRETKYGVLERLQIGQSARLNWRGARSPVDGAFLDKAQTWAWMALGRIERKTGFEFARRDDGEGLRVTRIK